MQHRFSTIAKFLATGVWIGAVALALSDRETYETTLASPFFCFALLTATVIHLRVFPRLRDALWIALLAGIFAALDLGILRFRIAPAAFISFLGCASLVLMGVK